LEVFRRVRLRNLKVSSLMTMTDIFSETSV